MKPFSLFVLLLLASVSSQAHTVSKGNSSLRGKRGEEGGALLKKRYLKGSKYGKSNGTTSSTSGGGDSNRVTGTEGTNIGTASGNAITHNRAGTSVVAKGAKSGKAKGTTSLTINGESSNKVPGIKGTNIGTVNGDTTTYNRAGTSIAGTCNPNGNNKVPLPRIKDLDLMNIPLGSGCDTSSDCTTCCCFQNVFYEAGLVPQKGYCIDNTRLNKIMTLQCMAIEDPGDKVDTDGNLDEGQ